MLTRLLTLCFCLQKAHGDLLQERDVELLQNSSCKVDAATLKPAEYPEDREKEWWVYSVSPYTLFRFFMSLYGQGGRRHPQTSRVSGGP